MVVRVNGSTGIVTVSGTSGAPSLRGPDGNSGISFDGDQVIISSSGLVAATFSDSAATINNLSVDTTTLEFSPGSSGTPTVAPSGDLNTGIYFPAADTIGFAEGGNEAARIDSSGRVLIRTSSSLSTGGGNAPNLQVAGTVTDAAMSVFQYRNAAGAGGSLTLSHSRGTSVGTQTILQDDDSFGVMVFEGSDGTNPIQGALIKGEVDGTPGTNDMPGRLVFSTTADGASTPTERMRITSTGELQFNSGFGSVAPAFGVRAWCNADLTGSGSIRGSGNVSSLGDQGTGRWQFSFSTAMPDTNYAAVGLQKPNADVVNMTGLHPTSPSFDTYTTALVAFVYSNASGGLIDPLIGNLVVLR
jgi:hypothetical protein